MLNCFFSLSSYFTEDKIDAFFYLSGVFLDSSVILANVTIDVLSYHRSLCHINISFTHHVNVLYVLKAHVRCIGSSPSVISFRHKIHQRNVSLEVSTKLVQ